MHTNGSRAAQLINKLSNVRKKATNWNRPGFGKVYNEIKRKLAHLQDIQNTITSLEDVRKKKLIREDLEVLLYREEIMWTQKARSNWILYGDRNIKYFQIMIRQRRARYQILHIKYEEGILIDEPNEIENTLVNHFMESYEDSGIHSVDSILNILQTINIPKLYHQ